MSKIVVSEDEKKELRNRARLELERLERIQNDKK